MIGTAIIISYYAHKTAQSQGEVESGADHATRYDILLLSEIIAKIHITLYCNLAFVLVVFGTKDEI